AARPARATARRLFEDHAPVVAFEAAEEAARVSLVAGDAAHLLDLQEDAVLVAVDQDLLHPLHVPGGVALDPELVARRAPVGGLPGGERVAPRCVVHIRHHEHLPGAGILRDRGDEAPAFGEIRLQRHGPSLYHAGGLLATGAGMDAARAHG